MVSSSLGNYETGLSSRIRYNIVKVGKQRILSIYSVSSSLTTNLFNLSEDNHPKTTVTGIVTLMDTSGIVTGTLITINTNGVVTTFESVSNKYFYTVLVYEVA